MLQGRNTRAEIDKGKTIECDVKSYQEKKNIAKCTKLWQKVLKLNLSYKEMLLYPTYVWYNKINFNKKRSRKYSN